MCLRVWLRVWPRPMLSSSARFSVSSVRIRSIQQMHSLQATDCSLMSELQYMCPKMGIVWRKDALRVQVLDSLSTVLIVCIWIT